MLSVTREVYNIVSLLCVQGHTVGPYLKPGESKPSCYVSINPNVENFDGVLAVVKAVLPVLHGVEP